MESLADVTETTPADVTDTSDAVISSSESSEPISNGNDESLKLPSSEDSVKSEGAVDEPAVALAASSPQPDDDLVREMEEIEGDKKSSEESVNGSSNELPVKEKQQETSDLLKELENDVGESSDVVMESIDQPSVKVTPENKDEVTESPTTSESPDASCVDSTTDPSVKSSESEVIPTVSGPDDSPNMSESNTERVQIVEIADDEHSAMEVDDSPEPVVEEPIDKDEGISSTSTDDIQSSPRIEEVSPTAEDNCTTVHQEAESSSTPSSKPEIVELKDEAVTSSEDKPDASSNEADSSDAKALDEAEPFIDAPVELNHTLDSNNINNKAENKLLTNLMMNNGSSTPNSNPVSAAATPNVFNSTPISKQFEISSENVSKIDEHSATGLTSHNASAQEDIKTSDTTFSGKYHYLYKLNLPIF